MKGAYNGMAQGIFELLFALRVVASDLGHDGISDDVPSASDEAGVRFVKKLSQGI